VRGLIPAWHQVNLLVAAFMMTGQPDVVLNTTQKKQ